MAATVSVTKRVTINRVIDCAINELTCSVDFEPLYNAVNLVPCNHKINAIPALKIFGAMNANLCALQGIACPLCNRIVTAYSKDPVVRNLANQIFSLSHSKIDLPAELKRRSDLTEEETAFYDRAEFVLEEKIRGRFGYYKFVSTKKTSLLKSFSMMKNEEDKFVIIITFRRNDKRIPGYFESILGKNPVDEIDLEFGLYKAEKKLAIKIAFYLLVEHNSIPEEFIGLLTKKVDHYTS
jgi:hypothetical protein